MKPRLGPPADLMTLFIWPLLWIIGIGLVASGALHVFNWLAASR